MGRTSLLPLGCSVLALLCLCLVKAKDTYKYHTWTATYGIHSPPCIPPQVILINDQFPVPRLDVVTNDNIIFNLVNKLDEPFLLTRENQHVQDLKCGVIDFD